MQFCCLGAFLLLVLKCMLSNAFDYCTNSLCAPNSHLACNNTGDFGASCNGTAEVIDMAPLQTQIVDAHNKYRNEIAKGTIAGFAAAARMGAVQWCEELATLALLNVNTCSFHHDKCFGTEEFPTPGQSLAFSSGLNNAEQAILWAIDNWFAENADASMANIDAYTQISNGSIGHFTAMVNERNSCVGCAAVKYLKSATTVILFTCNYACNNFRNTRIYESSAKSAFTCETGTDPNYGNLCTTNEVYNWQNCNL